MLKTSPRGVTARGFTIVELMFGVALFAFVMMLALPSFTAMLNNSRLRDTGAAVMAGLQIARTEALRRNQNVEFVLTADDVDDASAVALTANTSGPNWAIRALDATSNPVAPLVEARSGVEGSQSADAAALYARVLASNLPATTTIRFDALGRSNVGATNTTYDVTPADTSLCRANGGDLRCVRVVVTPAGRVRMCDPSVDAVANPNDTRAC